MGMLFHHKKEIKEFFEEDLDKEELVCFEFSDQEIHSLKWKHEKEFEYMDNMYDVVYREHDGNKHLLWCYKDDFERELKKKINHFLAFGSDNDIQKSDNKKKLSHFFQGLFFQNTKPELDYFTYSTKSEYPDTTHLVSTDLSPVKPPPKTA